MPVQIGSLDILHLVRQQEVNADFTVQMELSRTLRQVSAQVLVLMVYMLKLITILVCWNVLMISSWIGLIIAVLPVVPQPIIFMLTFTTEHVLHNVTQQPSHLQMI